MNLPPRQTPPKVQRPVFGWICPRCRKSWSPDVRSCYCDDEDYPMPDDEEPKP